MSETRVRMTCPCCRTLVEVVLADVHCFVCTDDESHNAYAFPCENCGQLQTKPLDHDDFNRLLRPAGVEVSYFSLTEVREVQNTQIREFAEGLEGTLERILSSAA